MDVITRIKERQDALRGGTRHVFTRAAKCIDVDGGIFKIFLFFYCCLHPVACI
jgi:hypothetical protein